MNTEKMKILSPIITLMIILYGLFVPIIAGITEATSSCCCQTEVCCCCEIDVVNINEAEACECRVKEIPEYPYMPEGIVSANNNITDEPVEYYENSIIKFNLSDIDFEISERPFVYLANPPPLFLLNSSFII